MRITDFHIIYLFHGMCLDVTQMKAKHFWTRSQILRKTSTCMQMLSDIFPQVSILSSILSFIYTTIHPVTSGHYLVMSCPTQDRKTAMMIGQVQKQRATIRESLSCSSTVRKFYSYQDQVKVKDLTDSCRISSSNMISTPLRLHHCHLIGS